MPLFKEFIKNLRNLHRKLLRPPPPICYQLGVALGGHPITASAYRFLVLPPWEATGRFCFVMAMASFGPIV